MDQSLKIAIIGAGHVGSQVANALLSAPWCREIVLHDILPQKALAEAEDLNDAAAFLSRAPKVYAGDYGDIGDADAAVMGACGHFFEENRLNEFDSSLLIAKEVAQSLLRCGFQGKILSITNPCDLIAMALGRYTGLFTLGTGTALDSARLTRRVAESLCLPQAQVEAYMLGEHGDSQVAAFSCAQAQGQALKSLKGYGQVDWSALENEVVTAGSRICAGKGFTGFGIGQCATKLLNAMFDREGLVSACSALATDGRYGAPRGLYFGHPCRISAKGLEMTQALRLSPNEEERLHKSLEILAEYAGRIGS